MKIIVTRSYSRKIQLKTYEPFEAFCSAQMEIDDDMQSKEDASRSLDEFCRAEVAKTIEAVRPSSAPLRKVDKKKSKEQAHDAAENDAGHGDDI